MYTIPLHIQEILLKLWKANGIVPLGVPDRLSAVEVPLSLYYKWYSVLFFLYEHKPPDGKEKAPIQEWTTPLSTQPTVGATAPSQLYFSWDAKHADAYQTAQRQAAASIPKVTPTLSTSVEVGEFDELL